MKNKGLKLLVLILVICGLSSSNLKAQEIKLGGGLIIGTDIPPLGLQFKGTYGMDMMLKNLTGSLEFGVFFPSTQNNYDHSRWTLDIDGNYTVWNAAGFDFYGIAGLNISHYAKKANNTFLSDNIGTKPGLNAGFGVNYGFSSKLSAYSEIKYVLSNYNQAVFNFGVLFEL